jgi:hypothetical protein
MLDWIKEIGLKQENVYEHEIPDEDRAFYSKRTIDFEFDFPFGKNTFSQEFKYPANLRSVGLDNIDSYNVTINGLFYGSNIFDNVDGQIQVNSEDILEIVVVKTDNTIPSKIQLSVQLV